ncbi:DUF1622 domain-containing protein [Actinomycetospora chlora]|uniref:DUF1622 domain-containing protein n=1 Tax=Actinomycetospora chlora TaxID=663608 RepID=A0ABP9BU65_9PSEU
MHRTTGATFVDLMDRVAQVFEVVAVGLLVVGLVWSLVLAGVTWVRSRAGHRAFVALRESFGGTLLLGVEVLVAADLIRTIAVEPTVENVAVLGLIVVIRTFLSFSLEIEIEGVPPWRRALVGGASRTARAARRALTDAPGAVPPRASDGGADGRSPDS